MCDREDHQECMEAWVPETPSRTTCFPLSAITGNPPTWPLMPCWIGPVMTSTVMLLGFGAVSGIVGSFEQRRVKRLLLRELREGYLNREEYFGLVHSVDRYRLEVIRWVRLLSAGNTPQGCVWVEGRDDPVLYCAETHAAMA